MRQMKLFGVLLVFVTLMASCEADNPNKIKINKDWKFLLLDDANGSEDNYHLSEYDDSNWNKVSLPHTANIEPLVVNDQWQGTCWYRKSFNIPETSANKSLYLELEAAMNHSKLWINGMQVAVHQGGYLPVVVDITKYVKKGQLNVLAVRLNNTDNAITGPKPLKRLDFNMYGGLYRNAWLIVKDKVHISHPVLANKTAGGGVFITTPLVDKSKSIVRIKTHVLNESDQDREIEVRNKVFFKGKLVKETSDKKSKLQSGGDGDFEEEFEIVNAQLWSPQEPNLYTVETSIVADKKVLDKEVNRIGVREYRFEGNDLYINNEKTYLRGVNRHQEYPYIGYALSDNAQYRDAKKIKEAGFDYVRLSHYPHSPAFMDACDELGLVVIDAILGWQYYLDNEQFRAYCYRSARELILRDRNHPCVLAWEVSLNETQMPVFFMQKLHDIVHEEYPSPKTYSCGWKNDVYDIFFQARQHRIMHHYDSIQPKPYMISEYGDWEYHSKNPGLNQHKLNDIMRAEMSSRQLRSDGEKRMLQQALNWQESHNDNHNTPAYGDGYWVMYDYNRGYHDNIESSGVMDIFRLPKLGYHFFKSQQSPEIETVLNIASYWDENSSLDVRVFSNCEEVKLYLNDKLIGTQTPDEDSFSTNLNHPPFTFKVDEFEPGILKAIGYIDGKEVKEYEVHTPGNAVALKLWIDESGKEPQAGVNDILFLHIAAVDMNGTVVPSYNEKIELDNKGDISIINPENINFIAGIATVVVKIGESSANVSVQAGTKDIIGSTSFKVID